jgi:hypothetical protein
MGMKLTLKGWRFKIEAPRTGSHPHIFIILRNNHLFSFELLFKEALEVCYNNNVAHYLNYLKKNQPNITVHTYGMLQYQLFTNNFNEGVHVSGGGGSSFKLCWKSHKYEREV